MFSRYGTPSEGALRELGYSRDELLRLSLSGVVVDRADAEQRYAGLHRPSRPA